MGEFGQKTITSNPPPELHSEQDMLAWKREYNIRQREADWRRRQDELLTQKQVAWEIERCECANRLASAREIRRKEQLEEKVFERHIEVDRKHKERSREVAITAKAKTWEQKENARLVEDHKRAKADDAEKGEARTAERQRRCDDLRAAAAERAETKKRNMEINRNREENIRRRDAERQAKSAENAQKLKIDDTAKAQEVVGSFVERTVPIESSCVSILGQTPIGSHYSHFGASATAIL